MDRTALLKEICATEKRFEKAKQKRNLITITGFAIAIFLLIWITERPTGVALFGELAAAFVLAGLHFVINGAVFGALFQRSEAERKELERLRNKLAETDEKPQGR